MHEIVTAMAATYPDLSLKLFLQCAQGADQCDFKAIAYEFVSQVSLFSPVPVPAPVPVPVSVSVSLPSCMLRALNIFSCLKRYPGVNFVRGQADRLQGAVACLNLHGGDSTGLP